MFTVPVIVPYMCTQSLTFCYTSANNPCDSAMFSVILPCAQSARDSAMWTESLWLCHVHRVPVTLPCAQSPCDSAMCTESPWFCHVHSPYDSAMCTESLWFCHQRCQPHSLTKLTIFKIWQEDFEVGRKILRKCIKRIKLATNCVSQAASNTIYT